MNKALIFLMLGIATPALAQTSLPSDSPVGTAPRVETAAPASEATTVATTSPAPASETPAAVPVVDANGQSVTVNNVTVAVVPAAKEEPATVVPAPVTLGPQGEQSPTTDSNR